jgi:hypothetical protein
VTPIHHKDDPTKDFLEVFKYALKFSEMSLEDNLHAFKVLSKRRLIYSLGLFWGIEEPDKLTDEEIKDQPYLELLYRYYEGGYSLSSHHLPSTPTPPATREREGEGEREKEIA